jgi:hypothetical protein
MTRGTVKLQIPFTDFVSAVKQLSLDDKRRLWNLLDDEMSQTEEDMWERDPAMLAEIRDARSAYETGDFLTIDQYDAHRREKRQ